MTDSFSRRGFLHRTTQGAGALAAASAAGGGVDVSMAAQGAAAEGSSSARPNILFIMTDQHFADVMKIGSDAD